MIARTIAILILFLGSQPVRAQLAGSILRLGNEENAFLLSATASPDGGLYFARYVEKPLDKYIVLGKLGSSGSMAWNTSPIPGFFPQRADLVTVIDGRSVYIISEYPALRCIVVSKDGTIETIRPFGTDGSYDFWMENDQEIRILVSSVVFQIFALPVEGPVTLLAERAQRAMGVVNMLEFRCTKLQNDNFLVVWPVAQSGPPQYKEGYLGYGVLDNSLDWLVKPTVIRLEEEAEASIDSVQIDFPALVSGREEAFAFASVALPGGSQRTYRIHFDQTGHPVKREHRIERLSREEIFTTNSLVHLEALSHEYGTPRSGLYMLGISESGGIYYETIDGQLKELRHH